MHQQEIDSARSARRQITDSLNALRIYRQSPAYKDSVTQARARSLDSMRAVRQRLSDSIRLERERVRDSMVLARQQVRDSMQAALDSTRIARERELAAAKAARERTQDSLQAARAYRQSPQFKDSVAAAREHRRDSLAAVRKAQTDSIRDAQQQVLDSMRTAREAYNDSMRVVMDSIKAERQRLQDSLTLVREQRADSMNKVREARKLEREEREEERKEKRKLALELKIKEKQENYSNEKMLRKKWTLPRKVIQNTFTRYNYYYNANLKMEEALANMQIIASKNYDSLIALYPFNPDVDSGKLGADMDSIISKASLGIQIHDPRSKWQDDLFLILGQAFYYKADYDNAEASFKYIVARAEEQEKEAARKKKNKEKSKLPESYGEAEKTGLAKALSHTSAKNEAMLWLAHTFSQEGEYDQASMLINMLGNDAQFPERLGGRLALEQAFLLLQSGRSAAAIPYLDTVLEDKEIPEWLRQRSGYLAAQLLQEEHKFEAANALYRRTLNLHPELEMEFYARKNIAFNNLKTSTNGEETRQMLEKMAAEAKYRSFYDQIHFALAQADFSENQPEAGIENLRKSIAFSQNNTRQKGYSYAALGDEFYGQRDYVAAKNAYDSAAMFLTKNDEPAFSTILKRGASLNHITAPGLQVKTSDSLIQLAGLSEKEQRDIIRRFIRQMERLQSDSLFRAQNANNTPPPADMNNNRGGSWYFANSSQVQQGMNAFRQKWGNRKLSDNWRRSSQQNLAGSGDSGTESGYEDNDIALYDEDELFEAIPNSPEALEATKKDLEAALFLLGKGFFTYLEDYGNALATFDTLDKRFPNHQHPDETLYMRYIIALRQNNPEAADRYLQQLSTRFPDSEWTRNILSAATGSGESGAEKNKITGIDLSAVQAHYDSTYVLLGNGAYGEALAMVVDSKERFPQQHPLVGRYTIVEALATAGTGDYSTADTLLSQFILQHPADSLTAFAQTALNYIKNRKSAPPSQSADSLQRRPAGEADVAQEFTFAWESGHYIIVAAPADNRLFALKAGVLDFNLLKHAGDKLSTTMTMLNPDNNLLIVKPFETGAAAKMYLNTLKKERELFREYENKDYSIWLISESNYRKLLTDKDPKAYDAFYKKRYPK